MDLSEVCYLASSPCEDVILTPCRDDYIPTHIEYADSDICLKFAAIPPLPFGALVAEHDGAAHCSTVVNVEKRKARRQRMLSDILSRAVSARLPRTPREASDSTTSGDDCSTAECPAAPELTSPAIEQVNAMRVALATALCAYLNTAPRALVLPLIDPTATPTADLYIASPPDAAPAAARKRKPFTAMRVPRAAAPDLVHAADRLASLLLLAPTPAAAAAAAAGAGAPRASAHAKPIARVELHGTALPVARWCGVRDADADFDSVVLRGECLYYANLAHAAPPAAGAQGAGAATAAATGEAAVPSLTPGGGVSDAERRLMARAAAAAAVSHGVAKQVPPRASVRTSV